MNLKDATLRSAVTKLLLDELKAADIDGRAATLGMLLAAHEGLGLKSVRVDLPDGTHVANATLPQAKDKVVIDDTAFLKMVDAEHPEEIVKTVNPAYRKAVEKCLVVDGDQVVDTRTGEPVTWAAVRRAPAQPSYFTVTFEKDGREAIKQAWRDGRLDPLDYLTPPALPTAGDGGGDAA